MSIDEVYRFPFDCGNEASGKMASNAGCLTGSLANEDLRRLLTVQRWAKASEDPSDILPAEDLPIQFWVLGYLFFLSSGKHQTGWHFRRRWLFRCSLQLPTESRGNRNLDLCLVDLYLSTDRSHLGWVFGRWRRWRWSDRRR